MAYLGPVETASPRCEMSDVDEPECTSASSMNRWTGRERKDPVWPPRDPLLLIDPDVDALALCKQLVHVSGVGPKAPRP
jgi:hypothetical protein